ncbi:PREDICTED: V-set and immunoglobulin domain-containing protein 10 [Nanorana parkeri]|uniref:V-set and immunoglobulin domain-containing protein 10 n=1 Tax=Nanorana parkeri TaxID=125878 RepID=UPI000854121F|nr:PREDICTED: V-set and immunoglobulin domain-containing protein 10 [Nanorana parkeri]
MKGNSLTLENACALPNKDDMEGYIARLEATYKEELKDIKTDISYIGERVNGLEENLDICISRLEIQQQGINAHSELMQDMMYKVDDIENRTSLTTIIGEDGGQIILPCSTVGGNVTKVAWFLEKSSQELLSCDRNGSSDFRFLRDNVSSSLVISNLRLEDGGNYGCRDCSQTSESKPHIQLNVTSGPHNVTFSISPTNILPNGTLYTSFGSTINFSCSTNSIPKPKLDVFLYAPDTNPEMFHSVNESVIDFSLFHIAPNYEGNYTCSAENIESGRTVSSTLQLLVYYAPNHPIHCSANNTEKPSEIVLLCTWPGGHPDPVLDWEIDGKPLFNDTSGMLASSLNGSQFSAGQTLKCRGKHRIGKDMKQEYCQLQLSPPVPQSQPLRTCLTGENVTLSCSVSGANPPATITWLRNLSIPEVEIQPGKKYQIVQDSGVSYLTIVNCSHDSDEGYYICKGENGLATRDLFIWLSVNKPHNIVGLVSAILILFLLVVGLITGIIIYCDPRVYWKANLFRSGQSEVLVLVESEEEEEDDMEQTGNSAENGHYSDTVARSPNPPAANGNIYKHQVLFHQPPASISSDLVSEVSEETENLTPGEEL